MSKKLTSAKIKKISTAVNAAYVKYKGLTDQLKRAENEAESEQFKKYIGKHLRLKKGRYSWPLYDPSNYQYMYVREVDNWSVTVETFYQESAAAFCFKRSQKYVFANFLRLLKKTDVIEADIYEAELRRYIDAAYECCTQSIPWGQKRNYRFGTMQKPDII